MAAPKLRIGVDLDDVCIEFIRTLLDCYNKDIAAEYGAEEVDYSDFTSWDLIRPKGPLEFDSYDELWEWVTDEVLDAWGDAPAVSGAQEALQSLADQGHHLVCITSKATAHRRVAYEAITNHGFPFNEVHVTDYKIEVPRCDVYIDDSPKHLEALTQNCGDSSLVIRFERPWNRPGEGTVSAQSWVQVLQHIDDWQNPAILRPGQPEPIFKAHAQHRPARLLEGPLPSREEAVENLGLGRPAPFYVSDDEEVRVTDPKTGGQKGQKLARFGAIDPVALLELSKVAGYGAQKYAAFNYLKGYAWSLSFDALQRHLLQFWSGEDYDTESGRLHVAHAGWHCAALTSFILRGLGTDDRFRA